MAKFLRRTSARIWRC